MTAPDPGFAPIPRPEAPLFDDPWEARALAIAALLSGAGALDPGEWSATLGAQLRAAPEPRYYDAVLAALDRMLERGDLLERAELAARIEAWRNAHASTPHGQPVTLPHRP